MTRVVLLEDYLDYAKQLDSVQQLARRTDFTTYTTKAASDDEKDIKEILRAMTVFC